MIRLQLFGSISLEREDGSRVGSVLAQPKRCALLAYLAACHPPVSHSRDTLMALLWPERDEKHARVILRQYLYQLRLSLGSAVLTGKGEEWVGVDSDRLWCDAAAFQMALGQGRREDALELYRGPLLEGFHLSGAGPFERWLEIERRRLQEEARSAAAGLAEEADRSAEARRWLTRGLEIIPTDEELVLRLMEILDGGGDRAGALRVYEALVTRLERTFGIEPSPETRDLAARIRDRSSMHRPAGSGTGESSRPTDEPHAGQPEERQPSRAAWSGRADPTTAERPRKMSFRNHNRSRRRVVAFATLLTGAFAVGGYALHGLGDGGAENVPEIRSLAVLPLKNLSGDPEQEYFTQGMTEALIGELAQISALNVISPTSAARVAQSDQSTSEMARELGVEGLIEGAVLRAGDEVRITLQLAYGPTDRLLWSESYERDLRDVLQLQGEVARAVAGKVRASVTPGERARLTRARSIDPQIYETYLRAKFHLSKTTEQDHHRAIELLEEIVSRDSTYAPAYALLGGAYANLPHFTGASPSESNAIAKDAALRALELDPALADAHILLGWMLAQQDWEWAAAEARIQRGLELNPGSALGHFLQATLLAGLGRSDEALRHARRAVRLDPVAAQTMRQLAYVLFFAREYEAAIAQARKTLDLHPRFAPAHYTLAIAHLELGQGAEAVSSFKEAYGIVSNRQFEGWMAYGYARSGRVTEARAILRRLVASQEQRYVVPPRVIALTHLALGQRKEALRWLEAMVEEPDPALFTVPADPRWDPLRADERFQALLARVRFP